MKLIADSGSTKTDWTLWEHEGAEQRFQTQGINPFHQVPDTILSILQTELLPQLKEGEQEISEVYFYGAGCTPEKSVVLKELLQSCFTQAAVVEVESDMLGAARALCGHHSGIVAILGTGSNSCYYDGTRIVQNTPALGYILGDEGSGATLGKRLVGDCLKGQLPDSLCKEFLDTYQLTQAEIIERVYRRPLANRFLAGLSPFLYKHRKEESIHRLLISCFEDFVQRNLTAYPHASVHFIGSVAHYYQEELSEVVKAHHITLATIQQSPMEGLIHYHCK